MFLHALTLSLSHTHTHTHSHTIRIVVGAPKGTYPGGLSLNAPKFAFPPVNETGLVYQCPVSPGECGPIGDGSLPVFDALRKNAPACSEYRIAGGNLRGTKIPSKVSPAIRYVCIYAGIHCLNYHCFNFSMYVCTL